MRVYMYPLILVLSGCAAQATITPQTLSEKLKGKTPQERQEILRVACLDEATWKIAKQKSVRRGPHHTSPAPYDSEASELKELCREMTDAYPLGKE